MDELRQALRGAPGLVEHTDSLIRLNRGSRQQLRLTVSRTGC